MRPLVLHYNRIFLYIVHRTIANIVAQPEDDCHRPVRPILPLLPATKEATAPKTATNHDWIRSAKWNANNWRRSFVDSSHRYSYANHWQTCILVAPRKLKGGNFDSPEYRLSSSILEKHDQDLKDVFRFC